MNTELKMGDRIKMKPFNEEKTRRNYGSRIGFEGFHGDVIQYRLEKLPDDFYDMPICDDCCIAYGEVTGHVHMITGGEQGIDFDLRRCPKTKKEYLKVNNVVYLKHQEHCPVEIPPGIYEYGRQLEYDPFEKRLREVAD